MKIILEIFHVRVMGNTVRYQWKQANLSKRGGDPNRMIQSLIQEKRDTAVGEVEKKEFITHSTSWRYMQPDKIMLTYLHDCGLVVTEQEGRFIYYQLSDKRVRKLLALANELLVDVAKDVYECAQ